MQPKQPNVLQYEAANRFRGDRVNAPDGYLGRRSTPEELEEQIELGMASPPDSFALLSWIVSFLLGIVGFFIMVIWARSKSPDAN